MTPVSTRAGPVVSTVCKIGKTHYIMNREQCSDIQDIWILKIQDHRFDVFSNQRPLEDLRTGERSLVQISKKQFVLIIFLFSGI